MSTIPADSDDSLPKGKSMIVWLVSILEGAVAVVSGALGLFMAFQVVLVLYFAAFHRDNDSTLQSIFCVLLFLGCTLWCVRVSRRCAREARRVAKGDDPPSGFWSLDLTSGLSFVLIIGAISAFCIVATHQQILVVERGRVEEAARLIDELQSAQAIYLAKHDRYSDSLAKLGNPAPKLKYFDLGLIAASRSPAPSWRVSFIRNQQRSSGVEAYSITFDSSKAKPLDCVPAKRCRDLLP